MFCSNKSLQNEELVRQRGKNGTWLLVLVLLILHWFQSEYQLPLLFKTNLKVIKSEATYLCGGIFSEICTEICHSLILYLWTYGWVTPEQYSARSWCSSNKLEQKPCSSRSHLWPCNSLSWLSLWWFISTLMVDSCLANYTEQAVLIIERCWKEQKRLNRTPNLDIVYPFSLGYLINSLNFLYYLLFCN